MKVIVASTLFPTVLAAVGCMPAEDENDAEAGGCLDLVAIDHDEFAVIDLQDGAKIQAVASPQAAVTGGYPTACVSKVVEYDVAIKTGDVERAGTNAKVLIQLKWSGSSAWSTPMQLDHAGYDDFQKSHVDVFHLTMTSNGLLEQVALQHDNTGKNPGWYVDWVEVYDKCSHQSWRANIYRWLKEGEGLYTTAFVALRD